MLRRFVLAFYLVPILVAAFLATLASASIGSLSGWGFPLQWKVGGCTVINGGLTCATEADNWLLFGADVSFYVMVGYGFLFLAYRLAPSVVTRLAILSARSVLFSTLFAAGVTLATGWLSTGQLVSPGGFSGQDYGFPLSWKTTLASCPPPCIQANGTQYNWILLIGDLLFYLTASYGFLLLTLRTPQKIERIKKGLESRKVLGMLGLAIIALSVGNCAFDSVYGTGNHWTGYGRLQLDHYSFQSANMVTVWLKDYGPGTVTIATLYIIDPSGYGLAASYSPNLTLDSDMIGMISENTTSQGLQLTRNGSYNLKIITSQNVDTTFSVTWT